jgi:signal transduction histidine kinase
VLLIIGLLLSVGILNTVVGLTVLSRNVQRPLNIGFFALALGTATWVLGIAAFMLSNDPHAALKWARLYYIGPLIIVAASVPFTLAFPSGGRVQTFRTWFAITGAFVLAVVLALWPHLLFARLVYHDWGKEIVLGRGYYLAYSAYLLIMFSLALRAMYAKVHTERGLYRSQAVIFLNGYFVSCVMGVFFNLALPWFGNYRLIWVGPLATSFYLFATAYGIIRHRLFDVRAVAARAVGYVLSMVALGAVYGVVAFFILSPVGGGTGASMTDRITSAVLAVGLAIIFRPVKRFFDKVTNKLFYRDAYDAQVFIDDLNHILVSTIDLDKLLRSIGQLVQGTLKASSCTFILGPDEPKKQVVVSSVNRPFDQQTRAAFDALAAVPEGKNVVVVDFLGSEYHKQQALLQSRDIGLVSYIRAAGDEAHLLGYFVLGPKKSGNPYNRQDIKMCGVLVSELALATQNAMRFREIQNFTVTLQEKIDDATRKLRRANDKLRKLNETKDDFISMASHQLRTPLTSVKGYTSMVLDGDAGKITRLQRRLLNQSFVSAQRMVYLISDLLNVSRLKTGKFIIEPVHCNLAKVIQEEVEQLQETAKSRHLELAYIKPEHFPVLMFDETKLRQVIMNFLDNAVYYTPAGGHIEVHLTDKPQSIEFTVSDDGIGVPRHEQHHLFTKFFRAPNAKRARPDGTGLGLFMAKKVIIAQGGAIIFRSQEGRGSTFGFTFAKARLLPEVFLASTAHQTNTEK